MNPITAKPIPTALQIWANSEDRMSKQWLNLIASEHTWSWRFSAAGHELWGWYEWSWTRQNYGFTHLVTIPNELLGNIYEFSDFVGHGDCGCSCKKLAAVQPADVARNYDHVWNSSFGFPFRLQHCHHIAASATRSTGTSSWRPGEFVAISRRMSFSMALFHM